MTESGGSRLSSPELLAAHLATEEELQRWERSNVAEAVLWTCTARLDPLGSAALITLHRKMFDRTWRWAGRLREPEESEAEPQPRDPWASAASRVRGGLQLPADPVYARDGRPGARAEYIREEIAKVVWSGSGWLGRGSMPAREALLQMHHALVRIRAFEGGNGRHARLWCDWVAESRGLEPVAWMGDHDTPAYVMRSRYREALRAADLGDWDPLNELYGRRQLSPISGPEAEERRRQLQQERAEESAERFLPDWIAPRGRPPE